jgi:hypothetical protein
LIARLIRSPSTPAGTFGQFVGFDFDFYSLEKPWVDADGNGHGDPQKSCITAGSYECAWQTSPKYGWCYEVTNVPERSRILIHPANWEHQLLGCIALGKARGVLSGKPAILRSKEAIKEFHAALREQPFTLEVSWK